MWPSGLAHTYLFPELHFGAEGAPEEKSFLVAGRALLWLSNWLV